jgi:hypothetical protein
MKVTPSAPSSLALNASDILAAQPSGGSETRPKNVAVNIVIKY